MSLLGYFEYRVLKHGLLTKMSRECQNAVNRGQLSTAFTVLTSTRDRSSGIPESTHSDYSLSLHHRHMKNDTRRAARTSPGNDISEPGRRSTEEFEHSPNELEHNTDAFVGMQDIGALGGPESGAFGVNKDGSVIVGTSLTSGSTGSNHSFVWTSTSGMQDLKNILDASGVHTADNWVTLDALVGVSADGKVMTGYGLNPRSKAFPFGVWTPFRVVLPVP